MWGREPKVRLSDVAVLLEAAQGVFQAGVDAATPGPAPEQIMMTPEQILKEQEQMQADAGWIATGGGPEEDE